MYQESTKPIPRIANAWGQRLGSDRDLSLWYCGKETMLDAARKIECRQNLARYSSCATLSKFLRILSKRYRHELYNLPQPDEGSKHLACEKIGGYKLLKIPGVSRGKEGQTGPIVHRDKSENGDEGGGGEWFLFFCFRRTW